MRQRLALTTFLFPALLWGQLTCEDEFLLTGSAVLQGECIRMTANTTGQQGCAWFYEETDFSMPFTHVMTVNFGNNDSGADGICLVYQSNNSSICGISGEGIGAQGIPNSFIVEFDTYQNAGLGDPVNDHAGININGDFTNNIDGPIDLGNIEDGNDYEVTFSWDPGSNTYEVYFDGALIMSGVYDIINNCFGGSPLAYWGYTSSTGGATNQHLVCPGLPPEVVADAGTTIELPCVGASAMLDGTGSDFGPEFTYEWTTPDGNIVFGELTTTPTIDAEGTYTLTVYNTVTMCESMDEVFVVVNNLEAIIDTPPYLDCITGEIILSGAGSSSGPNITYQWSTPDGSIVSTNGDEATVDQPGEYILTVLYDDGVGTCMEEANVFVEENPDVPVAFALDEILTCDPPSVELDGTGSSEDSVFEYEWTTPDGVILAGETTLFPLVGAEGMYTLVVTNSISGCTADYFVFVTADQDIPDAIAIIDGDLGCGGSSLTIDGSLSSFGDEFTYDWTTTNGNIVSGADEQSPVVNQPGEYTLLVTNIDNGCTDEMTVTVDGGDNNVAVDIAMPIELTCLTTSMQLDGSGSQPNTGVTYNWSTMDGQIDTDIDLDQITVSTPGTYTLLIEETSTGCSNTASVVVTENITPPEAEAGTAMAFGCTDTSQPLNGNGSSIGNFSYTWSTSNGVLLSGQDTLTPQVGSAGTYTLLVTNNQNGCTATDQVVVPADSDTPTVQISLNDTLDCTTNTLLLNATGSSSGMEFNAVWSTPNGNFVSGTDGLQPIVDQTGTYTLSITDTGNGCSNDATVLVLQDTQLPLVQIAEADTLNCVQTSLNLNASGSSTGADFTSLWTTTNGQLAGALDSVVTTITAPGDYLFTVSNDQNGCRDSALVNVTEDILTPDLLIATPAELNCTEVTGTLAGSLNNSIPNASFLWSTPDGSITSGGTSLQPQVNGPGTYQLIALNTVNECADTASVVVTQDITPPIADAGPSQLLNCSVTNLQLGGSSSSGNPFTYLWISSDIPLTVADSLLNLNVTDPGTFVLQVTNTLNTCVAFDTVMVTQDITPPVAIIALPPLLTCTDSLSLLNGASSTGTSGLTYAWSTSNGSLVGNPVASQLNAGQAGTYQLIVTQTGNACSDTTSIEVLQDDNFPTAMIMSPLDLTCERLSVNLLGTANSNSGNTLFSWSTADGHIVADTNTLQPEVDQAGTYTLMVEDGNNNCRAQAQIVVVLDNTPPLAAAGLDTVLNCTRTSLQLDAQASTQGTNMNYAWTTAEGNILSGSDGQLPTINAAGIYTLEVLNTNNGCRATDELTVSIDTLAPMPQIALPIVLTCVDTLATLDASGSTTTGTPSFTWTSTASNPIGNSNTNLATVGLSGGYQLELTDTGNGCVSTAEVTVDDNLTPPDPQIALPELLTCTTTSLTLDASLSAGNILHFAWFSPDGQIDAGGNTAMPDISVPGQYDLLLTDESNGCTSTASVMVDSDTSPPLVLIQDAITVDCNNPEIDLEAFVGSNTGVDPQFQWNTTDGNILLGANTLMPTVNEAGSYALAVTNIDNGCIGRDTIIVRDDLDAPMVSFALPEILNCTNETVVVDAGGSTGTSALEFSWASPDGNILTSTTESDITVNTPGDYGLLLTNTNNGCTDSLGLTVTQDTVAPIVMIAMPGILDCTTPSFQLNAAGSDDASNFMLDWSTVGGQIDSATEGLSPTVSQPGAYTLTILNIDNGCTSEASVEVEQNDDVPVIIFTEPDILTCVVNSVMLDAEQSSMGTSLTYQWTTTNGQIITGDDGLSPEVGAPGDYILTIIDISNGCENDATLSVDEDIALPMVNAGPNFTLDCTTVIDFLDGTGSSQGGIFTAQWSTGDGSIVSGSTSLTPGVDLPGTYQLLITNTENGCTASDAVVVDENAPLGMIETSQPPCFGDDGSISFTSVQGGTPPYLYTIDGGDNLHLQSAFFNVEPGLYTTQVEDSNGCIYEEVVEIIQPDSLVIIFTEPELEIEYGDSVRLIAQTNYPPEELVQITWEDAATLSCDDCLVPYASPTESGYYQLAIVSTNGCRDDALVRVLVNREFPVYFPSAFSPDGDGNNDFFFPFARLGAVTEVQNFYIFDRWGDEVYYAGNFQPNDPSFGWDGTKGGLRYNPAVFVYIAEVELADGRIEIFKGDVTLVR